MWNGRYWAARFFSGRYWAKIGGTAVNATRTFLVSSAVRRWIVPPALRRWARVAGGTLIYTAKDPNSTEDFVLDWVNELGADTISSAAWVVAGVTLVSNSNTTTTTTARLSGGTDGRPASATCTATLASGQVKRRAIQMTIGEQ